MIISHMIWGILRYNKSIIKELMFKMIMTECNAQRRLGT